MFEFPIFPFLVIHIIISSYSVSSSTLVLRSDELNIVTKQISK